MYVDRDFCQTEWYAFKRVELGSVFSILMSETVDKR